ncbi:hypothetical protein BVC80_1697g21 [Macleaya cordata]|uniref:Endonuclease/exonuclease/phosphatase n=1 Tax=Macleaya cordata TaxID=56857 RepID=A0A200PPE1_MACCD|nr:hypothetical protein BVC80_1697g21 [Macleaya cordata]
MSRLIRPFHYPHVWFQDSIRSSGGLALLWKDGLNCDIVFQSRHMVHLLVSGPSLSSEWLLTCMYGSSIKDEKLAQWSFLKDLSTVVDLPWAIIGDLNFIFSLSEKDGGRSFISFDVKFIHDLISEAGLSDFHSHGPSFTWSNHRHGLLIFERKLIGS